MSMRVSIAFPRPLTRADKLGATVSLSALAGCTRVRWLRGDRDAEVLGEGLAVAKIRAALDESGVTWEKVDTSLTPEEDQRLDEVAGGQERVKPPGR